MANNIKHAIIDSGMKQYEIAQKAGIRESRLSRIANGYVLGTIEELKKIAEVLEVDYKKIAN